MAVLHDLPAANPAVDETAACAAEGCPLPGVRRFFPGYVLTLCGSHHVATADQLRAERGYW